MCSRVSSSLRTKLKHRKSFHYFKRKSWKTEVRKTTSLVLMTLEVLHVEQMLFRSVHTLVMIRINSCNAQHSSICQLPIFTCICCHGVKCNVKSNWVAKLFSQAAAIGGEGWAATMLVNKTPLKWAHHNYCLYYPSRSRTEAPACNWLTNYPICARPIEIIVLVCSADMLTESYHSLWATQSISRCSRPTQPLLWVE